MNDVVKFEAFGKRYPLSIIDRDGNKWITAQQIGEAMGNKQIRRTLFDLKKSGEIIEQKHFSSITERKPGPGNPSKTILSYRGVIRVAMRSQGSRAKLFRDWAEEVLAEVMTTGRYNAPHLEHDVEQARAQGFAAGMDIAKISDKAGFGTSDIARLIHLRRSSVTQKEAALIFGCSREVVQRVERALKQAGVEFPKIHGLARQKSYRERLPILLGQSAGDGGRP